MRQRRKRELAAKRRRRRTISRLLLLLILAAAAVLLLIGIVNGVKKIRANSLAAKAQEEAEETAKTMDTFSASEVLHLSFPVLTFDDALKKAPEYITEENALFSLDNDGDGIYDAFDTDGDGIVDAFDTNGDTYADAFDTDADGSNEHFDTDFDSVIDSVDTTGDGQADSMIPEDPNAAPTLTVSQFNNILKELYNQGYVLVDIYSLADAGSGSFVPAKVSVPKGKKPLIISQRDVSYVSGYDGHADNLVLDSDGNVMNTFTTEAGSVVEGRRDVIPCLDRFIEEHPDFSFQGARGIIGLTGYRGLMGYAVVHSTQAVGQISQDTANAIGNLSQGKDAYGNALDVNETEEGEIQNIQGTAGEDAAEISDDLVLENKNICTDLLNKLRTEGWHFASNTYGLTSYASSLDVVKEDAEKWKSEIGSIVGTTDILLLPHGADLDAWSGYSSSNEKFSYLYSLGFKYYAVADENDTTWAQVGSSYVRQGVHEIKSLQGYRNLMNSLS